MILFLIGLAGFALLVGIVARRLRWIKSGGELGKARRAQAAEWAPEYKTGDYQEERR